MQRETFRKTDAGHGEVRSRARGLDAIRMAEPLRTAATPELFAAALVGLRSTLSAHMGRKLAEQLAREIAHCP